MLYHNVDLTPYNTFGIQCIATNLYILEELSQLTELSDIVRDYPKILVLGGGSNVILPEHYDGLVILVKIQSINLVSGDGDYVIIEALAGCKWDDLVQYAVNNNYYGIESLSLVPGSVGAAPVQNIGAYGTELRDVLHSVEYYNFDSNSYHILDNKDCQFAYRYSIFKEMSRFIITKVRLKLWRISHVNMNYAEVLAYMKSHNIITPTLAEIRNAIIVIRNNKLPDPSIIGNVGSFFHNPVIPNIQLELLKKEYPNLVSYPVDAEYSKIAAGWLIESAGLKGYELDRVAVYHKQALILINRGDACMNDVLLLVKLIQDRIYNMYQIKLNVEPSLVS